MVAPERSPAQVPENQPNDQNTTPSEESYSNARVPTSTGDTPIYDNWTPRPIDKEPKNHNKRNALIALGTIASGVILGVGSYLGIKSAANDQIERIAGSDRATAAPAFPTSIELEPTISGSHEDELIVKYDSNRNGVFDKNELEIMPPTDYQQLGAEIIADDLAGSFTEHLHTGWSSIKETLSADEEQVLYMPNLNQPRDQWSDQDYLNYRTLSLWLVTRQKNQDDGLRALSAIADPKTKLHENTAQWMTSNPGSGLKSVQVAIETPFSNKELHDVTIGEKSIGPEGGRIVGYRSLIDGSVNYTLFANTADENGDMITTSTYTYDTLDNPDLKNLIESYGQ